MKNILSAIANRAIDFDRRICVICNSGKYNKTAHDRAATLLSASHDKLHELAHFLIEKETINGEEFMALLD